MKLRTKILLAIIIAWGFVFLAVYIGSQQFLEKNYLILENESAIRSVKRVQEAINQAEKKAATIARSYAVWDSSYRFVQDRNQSYIDQNLIPTAIAANDFDMMLFYDVSGNPIFLRGLNEQRTGVAPLPKKLMQALEPGHSLWKKIFTGMNEKFQGFFQTEKGILILVVHPVLNSKGEGPIYGVMLAAKYFTQASIKKLEKNTKLNVSFYPLSVIYQNPSLQKEYQDTLSGSGIFLSKTPKVVYGYTVIKDIAGHPLGLIKVKMPSRIYLAGIHTIHNFNLVFLLSGIILAFSLFYLLSALIVKRLKKINKKIVEIELTRNFSLKLPEEGHDEIASLGIEGNKMLGVIRQYNIKNQELLTELNEDLDQTHAFLQKIQAQEALLSDIINSMPSRLIIVDKQLQIKIWNERVNQKTPISQKLVQGKNLFDFFPELKPYEEKIWRAVQAQFPEKIQKVTLRDSEGETHYLDVVVFPVSQSSDQESAIRIDDISSRVRFEEKILQNEKFAFIGILTSGVAHEISEPIHRIAEHILPLRKNIEDFLELLASYLLIEPELDFSEKLPTAENLSHALNLKDKVPQTKFLLNAMSQDAAVITDMVRELRVFSRLDENVKKKTNIHEGIDSALKLLYHRYKNRIQIIKEYAKIPRVSAYPGKLNQAFMNLIKNAIDEIPGEGIIEIETRQIDDEHVVIYIKDNGVGMDEAELNQIFRPFAVSEKNRRSSLGLSVTRNIIQQHGGSLFVKSEPGVGTSFIVTLSVN